MKFQYFQIEEGLLSENAKGIGKTYHEVIRLIKFLQTEPQVKDLNINNYDL